MPDYKKMYTMLFNAKTDAERLVSQAVQIMKKAQQEAENLFIESDDTPIELLPKDDSQKDDE